MSTEKTKQIKLYKNLGAMLINQGQWFLKKSFNLKFSREISKAELKNLFSLLLQVGVNSVYCSDRKYYVIDWGIFKSIIEHDWTDKKKYLVDNFDCDDYSNSFKARCSEIYNINSVGIIKSVKVHIIPENRDVYHRCNVIVATEDDILRAYIFEAQSDGFQQLVKGVPIQIGNWRYDIGSGNIEF